jgi:hypothetical protein
VGDVKVVLVVRPFASLSRTEHAGLKAINLRGRPAAQLQAVEQDCRRVGVTASYRRHVRTLTTRSYKQGGVDQERQARLARYFARQQCSQLQRAIQIGRVHRCALRVRVPDQLRYSDVRRTWRPSRPQRPEVRAVLEPSTTKAGVHHCEVNGDASLLAQR